jgi:hypothetical protein
LRSALQLASQNPQASVLKTGVVSAEKRCLGQHRFFFALKYKAPSRFKNFKGWGGKVVANLNVLSHQEQFI